MGLGGAQVHFLEVPIYIVWIEIGSGSQKEFTKWKTKLGNYIFSNKFNICKSVKGISLSSCKTTLIKFGQNIIVNFKKDLVSLTSYFLQ